MAEQVSFYDKLKSDMEDEIVRPATSASPQARAAARFATDYELGADADRARQFFNTEARLARDAGFTGPHFDDVQATRSGFTDQMMRINQALESPEARTDSTYRARLLQQRNDLANLAKRTDFTIPITGRGGRAQYVAAEIDRGPHNLSMAKMLQEMGGQYGPPRTSLRSTDATLRAAQDRTGEALARFDEMDVSNPTYESDRALSEAADDIRRSFDNEIEVFADEAARRPATRAARRGASNQLDLYRGTKNLIERNADDVIRAGKRALSSPAVKRGLGVAAGLMGSKIATAATSGGADLVKELAFGAPAAFIQGYNRSQEPYEQVKYVAEEMGPIDNLQRMSLNALSYDDVVRLRQEGHLTPKAQQQYRQHVIKTEGFDPDEVYRRQ